MRNILLVKCNVDSFFLSLFPFLPIKDDSSYDFVTLSIRSFYGLCASLIRNALWALPWFITRLVSTNSSTDIAFVLKIEYDLRRGQTINWRPDSLSISLTKSSLCRAHQWRSVRKIEITPTLNWIYSFLLGVFGKLFN